MGLSDFTDWLGHQASRAGYQFDRAGNAIQETVGAKQRDYDPNQYNWAGVQNQPGESGGGDFGNTLMRTGGYASAGAGIGSVIPGVGNVIGGALGGLAGLGQSIFGEPDAPPPAAATQAMPTPAANPSTTPAAMEATSATAATSAAGSNSAYFDGLKRSMQGQHSAWDPTTTEGSALIAALGANTSNAPYLQANGQDRGLNAAYNGGGAMGGYGQAGMNAIQAGADVQRDAAMKAFQGQTADHLDSWTAAHNQMLSQLGSADPSFDNWNKIYDQSSNLNEQDKRLALDAQQATDANNGKFVSGLVSAGGTALSSPTAMDNVGKVGKWVFDGAKWILDGTSALLGGGNQPAGNGVQMDVPPAGGSPSAYHTLSVDGGGPLARAYNAGTAGQLASNPYPATGIAPSTAPRRRSSNPFDRGY